MPSTTTKINETIKEMEVVLEEVPALIVDLGEDLTIVAEVVSAVDPKLGAPIAAVAKAWNSIDERFVVAHQWTK